MKKSVDIPGFPWYYIQALERDGKNERPEGLSEKAEKSA